MTDKNYKGSGMSKEEFEDVRAILHSPDLARSLEQGIRDFQQGKIIPDEYVSDNTN